MLYTLGFMKCVIAPTFGMAFWAWFVADALLFPELGVNEAAVAGVFVAVPLAVAFGLFCHYTQGLIRAIGVISAVIAILVMTPGLQGVEDPEFTVGNINVVLPPMIMVIGTAFYGFCFWPVIFPREILAIQGDLMRGAVQVALEDVNMKDGKRRN